MLRRTMQPMLLPALEATPLRRWQPAFPPLQPLPPPALAHPQLRPHLLCPTLPLCPTPGPLQPVPHPSPLEVQPLWRPDLFKRLEWKHVQEGCPHESTGSFSLYKDDQTGMQCLPCPQSGQVGVHPSKVECADAAYVVNVRGHIF